MAAGGTILITVQRITTENISLFKLVRLHALEESPSAFGSTYRREKAFSESEWLARVARWNGEKGVGFLAMEGDTACGIAGALVEPQDQNRAQLVSMWTAPAHRKQGVGRLLVNAVVDWAKIRRIETLLLMVTSRNDRAIGFYERMGFARTGRTEPYPNDPAVVEYEMFRSLA